MDVVGFLDIEGVGLGLAPDIGARQTSARRPEIEGPRSRIIMPLLLSVQKVQLAFQIVVVMLGLVCESDRVIGECVASGSVCAHFSGGGFPASNIHDRHRTCGVDVQAGQVDIVVRIVNHYAVQVGRLVPVRPVLFSVPDCIVIKAGVRPARRDHHLAIDKELPDMFRQPCLVDRTLV